MNFFRRLFGGKPTSSAGRMLPIYVLDRRCNEPIAGQVDLFNELSQAEEGEYVYHTRKVLHTSGERRCFSQVEVNLYFDRDKQLVHHEVAGGRWLDATEYQAELARFNAPPEEPAAPSATAETDAGMRDMASLEDTQPQALQDERQPDHAQTDDGRQLEDEQERSGGDRPGPGDS
jgi:hypothetical protein